MKPTSEASSPGTLAWKRGHARLTSGPGGGLEVAGAFCLAPVAAIAIASCAKHPDVSPPAPEAGCWHGFSAHTNRLAALRYPPLDATLFDVRLGGALLTPGNHWVAARQEVVAATFWALCRWCGPPVQATGLAPDAGGALPGALAPACGAPAHPALLSLNDFADRTGVPAAWASPDYVNWARSWVGPCGPAVIPRCVCRAVVTLRVDAGLAHYFRSLWEYDGAPLPDGSAPMRCLSCGQRWLYHRQTWPPHATKL